MPDTEKLLIEIKSLRKTVQLQKKVIELEIVKNKQIVKPVENVSWYQNEISQLRQELSEEKARKHEQQLSLERLIKSLLHSLPSPDPQQTSIKEIPPEDMSTSFREYSEFDELKEVESSEKEPSLSEAKKEEMKAPSLTHCGVCGVKLDGEPNCFSCGTKINY